MMFKLGFISFGLLYLIFQYLMTYWPQRENEPVKTNQERWPDEDSWDVEIDSDWMDQ